ncbi:MAG: hypothetical protein AB4426_18555 [Xenococcaceae cyanobacterium]
MAKFNNIARDRGSKRLFNIIFSFRALLILSQIAFFNILSVAQLVLDSEPMTIGVRFMSGE